MIFRIGRATCPALRPQHPRATDGAGPWWIQPLRGTVRWAIVGLSQAAKPQKGAEAGEPGPGGAARLAGRFREAQGPHSSARRSAAGRAISTRQAGPKRALDKAAGLR